MIEKSLQIIPIYRCSPEHYLSEIDRDKADLRTMLYEQNSLYIGAGTYDLDERVEKMIERRDWIGWRFNEIVGYIDLVAWGTQFRGMLHMRNLKRFRRGFKKKPIEPLGKIFGFETHMILDNDAAYQRIHSAIETTISENRLLKSRYVDLSMLERIGPHVGWLDAIESASSALEK